MYDFLLVINRPHFAPFLRYSYILAKISQIFPTPLSFRTLALVTRVDFMEKLYGYRN